MITLELQPAQARAFMTRATEVLYGGAAGGGKSYLIRAAFIMWATMIPGLQLALFRRMYPDLRANHMEGPMSFPVMLAPYVNAGLVRIVRDEITFWNGSRISLNHCQLEKDKFRYQGAEFHVLGFDELTHFSDGQYRYLRGRVRMTGLNIPPHLKGLFPRIISGSNPGGIGHTWVKKTFVNAGPMIIHRTSGEEGGMLRQYIPAKLSDNPALLASDPEYANRLYGLGDPMLVRAMMDGDWSIVAGAMFGETWREELHTCDPFAIPVDWQIWRGADDGYAAPACCAWGTQDPNTKTLYVLGEVYSAKMLPDVYARRVAAMDYALPRWHAAEREVRSNTAWITGELDSAAFSDTGTDALPRGHQINAELVKLKAGKFTEVDKWDGSRVHGVQNFHRLLALNPLCPRGLPGIRFFKNCVRLIEEIPALPRDPKKPEDVDTNAPDHGWDAVRYMLQRKFHRAASLRLGA